MVMVYQGKAARKEWRREWKHRKGESQSQGLALSGEQVLDHTDRSSTPISWARLSPQAASAEKRFFRIMPFLVLSPSYPAAL